MTAPTLEEQIAYVRDFYRGGIMDDVLASLKKLQAIESQPVPVEPLIVKCMRDPTWCGTEPTQILSYIDTLQSELKRVTEERDKEKEIMTPAENLAYELDGVISDVEKGGCFDGVCLLTIKRVRDALAAGETAPPRTGKDGRFHYP